MAQQLTEEQKAAIVCEFWFRLSIETTAIESITHIICAFHGREFVYESDYDGNGVVYWVGTKYGTEKEWQNPWKRGLIKIKSTEWDYGGAEDMVANEACNTLSMNNFGAWVSIEFDNKLMIQPTKYTLSHYLYYDGCYLRSWVFEGSIDGAEWTVIRDHSDDESLNGQGQSHSWDTPNAEQYFNRFRVRMTGEDSDGRWYLAAHALEIYGFVRG